MNRYSMWFITLLTHRFTPTNVQQIVAFSFIAIGQLLLPYYLQIYQPVGYIYFVSEDSWSEYVTFVFWIMTAAMLGWLLIRHPEFRKPGYFAFAGAAFLIAMEEISWGQRIIGYNTPAVLDVWNYQQEANLHNILLPDQYQAYLGIVIILAVAVVPLAARLFTPLGRSCGRWGIPLVSVRYWPLFAVPVYFIKDYNYLRAGFGYEWELAELGLAMAVSIFTLSMVLDARQIHVNQGFLSILASYGLVCLAVIITAPLVVRFSDSDGLRYGFFDVSSVRIYVERAMYTQAAEVFNYVRTHPRYAKPDSSYTHGLVLLKLKKHDEAQKVLSSALAQENSVLELAENDSSSYRRIGKILHAMDRAGEACQTFGQALSIDRKRLGTVSEAEEAKVRLSIAKTLFAMGQWNLAGEEVNLAIRMSQKRGKQRKFSNWYSREKRRALGGYLLPETISSENPACLKELNGYIKRS